MKKRFTKAVTITATVMLIGTMPFTAKGVLAGEKYPAIATYNDIATQQTTIYDELYAVAPQAEVSEVVIPVSVANEAWNCGQFGTWKALNIKVNDTMYPLSKDGSVSITFHNGDNIKVYAGSSYELWEGTVSISGDEINVKGQNVSGYTKGCNLIYSDGKMLLSGTQGYSYGNLISEVDYLYYNYDLTAKTESGTPIEGIRIKTKSIFNDYSYGMNLRYNIVASNYVWGNGNSYNFVAESIDDEGVWVLDTTRVTDQNGYTDMYLPDECISDDYSQKVYMGGNISGRFANGLTKAYISNGLVDVTINNENYTNTTALGIEASFGAIGTDKVLGDYYCASKMSEFKSNSVTLQDEAGKDIATVTMGLQEAVDMHLIGKDGNSYKATGLEPTVDVKMADGVTDWTVTVTSADNTFHINVVKKEASSDNGSDVTPSDKLNGLNQAEDGNWYYYVDNNIDTSYTGLANNEFGWWYINNGTVDFNCNTLVEFNGAWWKVENGQVNFDSNTVAEFNGAWWKITNGQVDFGFTGLASNEFGWWYISGGQVDFNYNGVVENETGWWKVTNGAVDFEYNGVAENDFGWWKITNGSVDFNYTGLANNEFGWWYISNGAVDFTCNTLVEFNGAWWKVENGQVNFDSNTVCEFNGAWWKITNGAVDFGFTGLANNEFGWWYINNGMVDFNYTGTADNEFGTWNVVNGQVVF